MKEYELLYIVSPRVAVDDVPSTIERVSALIRDSGGELLSVDNWGRRRMAYPIKHYFEGTYVLATLRMEPAAAAPLEASLIISEEVIRHLLTEGIIPPTSRDRGRPMGDDRERMPEPAEERPAASESLEAESSAREQDESDTPTAAPEPTRASVE